MRALVERSRDAAMRYEVAAVLSDQPAAAGLALARDLGVPARALIPVPSADRAAYDRDWPPPLTSTRPR